MVFVVFMIGSIVFLLLLLVFLLYFAYRLLKRKKTVMEWFILLGIVFFISLIVRQGLKAFNFI